MAAATQLRRRKEGMLASINLMSQDHPMLESYEKARESVNMLLRYIYSLEDVWPKNHLMTSSVSSLIDQLVRSATSVTANMQEGYGKATRESLGVFLRIARGSLLETNDHLISLGTIIGMLKNIDSKKNAELHHQVVTAWLATSDIFEKEYNKYTEDSVQIVEDAISHENSFSKKRKLCTTTTEEA
jgi:four helix bundle protein